MLTSVHFDGYILRSLNESDYPRLQEWIAADPAHREILDPEFFMGQRLNHAGELEEDNRATCYVLEDDCGGGPLFYIRISRAARVNIQFPPAGSSEPNEIVEALAKGMAFLEVALERAGVEEWIFSSKSRPLRRLANRTLGFSESNDELRRVIPRLDHEQEDS